MHANSAAAACHVSGSYWSFFSVMVLAGGSLQGQFPLLIYRVVNWVKAPCCALGFHGASANLWWDQFPSSSKLLMMSLINNIVGRVLKLASKLVCEKKKHEFDLSLYDFNGQTQFPIWDIVIGCCFGSIIL